MIDAYAVTLEALDHALGREGLEGRLPGAQAALARLRRAYRETGCPRYDTGDETLAYALAYHPGHIRMAEWAFGQAGPVLSFLDDRDVLKVVVLGVGPGAELVALADWVARECPAIGKVEATLVDRQPAWERIRAVVGIEVARRLLGQCELEVTSVTADLTSDVDRRRLTTALQKADLVSSHAVLSEVTATCGVDTIDWLCGALPKGTPLLLVDLERSDGGRGAFEHCRAAGMRTHANTGEAVRADRPPARLQGPFFQDRGDLWARRTLHARMQLVAQGDLRATSTRPRLALTACQQNAFSAFRQFLGHRRSSSVAILRGSAGTGKSTLIREFVYLADSAERTSVLMAPTGHARKRLSVLSGRSASTVHSQLYKHRRTDLDESGGREVTFDPKGPLDGDLWIVDEASLVGDRSPESDEEAIRLRFHEGRLLTDLLQALDDAPEGTQLVFVGDQYQLPPVGCSHSPALDATALSTRLNEQVPVWELETIVRQKADSPILETAARCRSGESLSRMSDVEETSTDRLASRAEDFDDGSAIVIAWANASVAAFNRAVRTLLGRRSAMPEAGDRLVAVRTNIRADIVNGDEMIVESTGAPFEVSRRLGTKGEVVTARLLPVVVSVESAGGRVSFDTTVLLDGMAGHSKSELEQIERVLLIDARTRFKASEPHGSALDEHLFLATDPVFNAVRAVYSYARTCHRAQGGEWELVIVDVSHERKGPAGWDYTAATRARGRLEVIGRRARSEVVDVDDELSALLADHALRCESTPLSHGGRRLDVWDGPVCMQVNVYVRRGVVSKIVPQKGDDALGRRVMPLLRCWAGRVRGKCQPILDERVAVPIEAAMQGCATDSVQLTCHQVGDWEVQIEAVARFDEGNGLDGTAELRMRYNGAGRLGGFKALGDGLARDRIDDIVRLLDSVVRAPRF